MRKINASIPKVSDDGKFTGLVDFVQLSYSKSNTAFRKLYISFPRSKGAKVPFPVGPLERAALSHGITNPLSETLYSF
jgi:hypothetical protein